jgi:hypothetical protein
MCGQDYKHCVAYLINTNSCHVRYTVSPSKEISSVIPAVHGTTEPEGVIHSIRGFTALYLRALRYIDLSAQV